MKIGIDSATGEVYEDGRGRPSPIAPRPLLTSALIGDISELSLKQRLPKSPHYSEWKAVFREDFFDLNSRIRRGRFYMPRGTSHEQWRPSYPTHAIMVNTFDNVGLSDFKSGDIPSIRVLLGTQELYSAWKVILVEFVNSAELLFTLKSTSMLGVLPDLQLAAIPERHRGTVASFSEKLADEVKRGTPDSIIDLSRNLASALLSAVNQEFKPGKLPQDLGKEADFLERECTERGLVSWYTIVHCSRVIARLHAEAKAMEQTKSGCRPPSERDAELALSCVDRILRCLDWAAL